MILIRLLLVAVSLVPVISLAGVYKCLDQNNKVFYQDKPCRELTSTGLSPELSQLAPNESRPHLLWRLDSDNKTIYLMGSLNYGSGDMYPLPEAIMDVFSGSKVLVIGNALDAGGNTLSSVTATGKGSYTDGSLLQEYIKPAIWERVQNLSKTLGISEEIINAQKPWMAALTLKNAAMKKAGLDMNLSVDKTFMKAAETAKPVLELDPIEEQVQAYDALSSEEWEGLLLEALYEADSNTDYFRSLVEAWKAGNGGAVELLVRRSFEALPASARKAPEQWLAARNESLAAKIVELAADGRPYFIVLDVVRLTGAKGVLALLQAKGFLASQL